MAVCLKEKKKALLSCFNDLVELAPAKEVALHLWTTSIIDDDERDLVHAQEQNKFAWQKIVDIVTKKSDVNFWSGITDFLERNQQSYLKDKLSNTYLSQLEKELPNSKELQTLVSDFSGQLPEVVRNIFPVNTHQDLASLPNDVLIYLEEELQKHGTTLRGKMVPINTTTTKAILMDIARELLPIADISEIDALSFETLLAIQILLEQRGHLILVKSIKRKVLEYAIVAALAIGMYEVVQTVLRRMSADGAYVHNDANAEAHYQESKYNHSFYHCKKDFCSENKNASSSETVKENETTDQCSNVNAKSSDRCTNLDFKSFAIVKRNETSDGINKTETTDTCKNDASLDTAPCADTLLASLFGFLIIDRCAEARQTNRARDWSDQPYYEGDSQAMEVLTKSDTFIHEEGIAYTERKAYKFTQG